MGALQQVAELSGLVQHGNILSMTIAITIFR